MRITTADAMSTIEARGYLFDIGQFAKETKIFLWRMVKMGRLRKAVALWPWFVSGTAMKTVYCAVEFDPMSGVWCVEREEVRRCSQ